MTTRQKDRLVYLPLMALTSLYALALDRNHEHADRKITPDWTWMEVVCGCCLCLLAGGLRVRLDEAATWQDAEIAVWKAFSAGGTPIIIWQVWRAYARQRQRGDIWKELYETQGPRHAPGQRPPGPLAALRRPRSPADDRNN
jgi:hypothetical protein